MPTKAKISWVHKHTNEYHEVRVIGLESILVYFIKKFFDEDTIWIHLEKLYD